MDLLQLTYFCDAAESENFSRTAEKFTVPTSNISQVIRRLEKDLGAPLFERNGNRVHLNDRGRIFYRHARVALDAMKAARQAIGDEDEISGELRIFVGCNRASVAKAIERFRIEYPSVFFSLDHHRLTEHSAYDLIISDNIGKEGYEKRLLIQEKLLIAVNKDHPLAARRRIDIAELAKTRFITMHEDSCLSRLFHRVCRGAGFEPHVVIRCDDPAYMRRYVEMGLGAAFFPAHSWHGLFSEGVICLEPRTPIRRETYAFFRADSQPSLATQLFTEALVTAFGEKTL